MAAKVPKPAFNYEKLMLPLFPLITLGLFLLGILLLWLITGVILPLLAPSV